MQAALHALKFKISVWDFGDLQVKRLGWLYVVTS